MIRKILVGLDGSPGSRAATELGARWAVRCGAELTGAAVVDAPSIHHPQMTGTGGGYYQARARQARTDRAVRATAEFAAEFATACAAAGARATARVEAGDPVETLLELHDDYDVTLLPREGGFAS